MPIALVDATLRGAIVALLGLLLVLLSRSGAPQSAARRGAQFICAGLVVQVLASMPWVEQNLPCGWQAPLVGVSVGNALLFWLFTASLFNDDFRWRRWHAVAWAGTFAVGALQCLAAGGDLPAVAAQPLRVLLRLIPALCALAALGEALRHWGADLIETRRRLRLWLLVGGSIYTAVQLAARLGSERGLLSPRLALLDMGVLALLIGGMALLVLRVRAQGWWGEGAVEAPDAPRPARRAVDPPAATPGGEPAATPSGELAATPSGELAATLDEPVAEALQRAMAEERLYRSEDLSIATLAARLALPEYRLRRHINQRLGFRNFNAFVNSWRLADAQRWLADPTMRDTPILTLALDAGFQSIGPFNRAFKAATGLTPSDYRRQQLEGAPDAQASLADS